VGNIGGIMRNRRKRLIFRAATVVIVTALEVPMIRYLFSEGLTASELLAVVRIVVPIVVVIFGVVFWLPKAVLNAGQTRLQAQHPGALIVQSFWSSAFADTFLRSGQRPFSGPATGCCVELIVDKPGIKVFFMGRHPALYGTIPWESVRSVHIGEASVFLYGRRTRPTIVIDHEGDQGPFVNRIVLLIIGKEARASAAELPGMILARRPV
jgi:hypothetical protein